MKAVKFFAPRIEATVHDVRTFAHQGWFKDVATAARLFEKGCVKMECSVLGLIIERHHLYAKRPEEHRIKIGWIDAHAGGICAQQLRLRVA